MHESSLPPVRHLCAKQLKKKKQAAKRKSVAAEDVDTKGVANVQGPSTSEAAATTTATPAEQNDGSTRKSADKRGVGEKGGADAGGGLAVDEEMPDVSTRAALKGVTSSENVKMVKDTESSGSVVGNTPPMPPEVAADNGTASSACSKQHKKSVSFVAREDMDALLDDNTDVDGNVLPPVPPLLEGASGDETPRKEDKIGTNLSFLHRNFRIGENVNQVRHLRTKHIS